MAYFQYNGFSVTGHAHTPTYSHGEGYCIICGMHHLGDPQIKDDALMIAKPHRAKFRGEPVTALVGFQENKNDSVFQTAITYLEKGYNIEEVFRTLKVIDHPFTFPTWEMLLFTPTSVRKMIVDHDTVEDIRVITNARTASEVIYSGRGLSPTDPLPKHGIMETLSLYPDPYQGLTYPTPPAVMEAIFA